MNEETELDFSFTTQQSINEEAIHLLTKGGLRYRLSTLSQREQVLLSEIYYGPEDTARCHTAINALQEGDIKLFEDIIYDKENLDNKDEV